MEDDVAYIYLFGKTYLTDNEKFFIRNDSIIHMAAGDRHTIIVTESGRTYAFGNNTSGQLGLGHTNSIEKVLCIESLSFHQTDEKVLLAACGCQSSLVATNFGSLYAFGSNHRNQLGFESKSSTTIHPFPIKIEHFSTKIFWKQLSMGAEHTCALSNDGQVYLWGSNIDGQCGFPRQYNIVKVPKQLKFDYSIMTTSCGYYHTAIVTINGRLFVFGNNSDRQLASLNLELCFEPKEIFLPDRVQAVACGNQHTVVLTDKGNVYTCGRGNRGQLGLGHKISYTNQFRIIETLPQHLTTIAAGEGHTAIVDSHGEIYLFGDNEYNQLHSNIDPNIYEPFFLHQFRGYKVLQVVCGGCQTVILAKKKSIGCDSNDDITRINSLKMSKLKKYSSLKLDFDELSTTIDNALSHTTREEIHEKLKSENRSKKSNLQVQVNFDDDKSSFDNLSIRSQEYLNQLSENGCQSPSSTNSGCTSSSISSIENENSTLISEIEEDLQHSFYSSTSTSSGKFYRIVSKDNDKLIENAPGFFSRIFASNPTQKCSTTTATRIHESKICSLM